MALALNIGKCSLLGNYRENNEDSIDVKQFPDMTVCLVADGMGGQAAGEVASKRAIEIVPRELKKHLSLAMGNEETKNIVRRSVVIHVRRSDERPFAPLAPGDEKNDPFLFFEICDRMSAGIKPRHHDMRPTHQPRGRIVSPRPGRIH